MTGNGYYTLKQNATAEIVDRKSVFIGYARPVGQEDEALAFIKEIRARHADASHNVYAYALREGNHTRFSDDGEPHGTAGLPVLEVLRKELLTDCVVVITRYFGGTLLGTGGLVRAYSAAAKSALNAAGRVFLKPFTLLTIQTDYGRYQRVSRLMADFKVKTRNARFTEDVTIEAAVDAERRDTFIAELKDATNDCVVMSVGGVVYDYEENE